VLWHCWLGVRKSVRAVKIEWWGVGVCLEWGSGLGTMGTAGYIVPPKFRTCTPNQRCGLCQNFQQTTLTTRLYKVFTNLYPPLTKTFRRTWSEVQIVCIWSSWCDCQSAIPKPHHLCLCHLNPDILPFWYWLTQVVLERSSYGQLSELLARLDDWRYMDTDIWRRRTSVVTGVCQLCAGWLLPTILYSV